MFINSEFFKEILSRALIKIIKKKGYDIDLQIRALDIQHGKAQTTARSSVGVVMPDDKLKGIVMEAL